MTKSPKKTTRSKAAKAAGDPLERLIEATMELAARKDWDDITLSDIAAAADVPLAEARARVRCKGDVLRALMRRTDERLLKALEKEPPRGDAVEKLFDVIMRRLELLAPYRAAVKRLLRQPFSVLSDCPPLLPGALVSQRWMLAAAGLEKAGLEGGVKTLGLELVWLKTLRTWVEDDDPALSATMRVLDEELRRGEKWLKRLDAPLRTAQAGRDLCRTLGNVALDLLLGVKAKAENATHGEAERSGQ